MNKYFVLTFALAGLITTAASAFVAQPASQALSLNSIVSKSKEPEPVYVVEKPAKPVIEPKTIDIRSGFAKQVSLKKEQDLIVIVPEKEGVSWKVKYDSACVSMVDNTSEGKSRKIKFVQKAPKDSNIFFDGIGADGSVVTNKAVYIKVY